MANQLDTTDEQDFKTYFIDLYRFMVLHPSLKTVLLSPLRVRQLTEYVLGGSVKLAADRAQIAENIVSGKEIGTIFGKPIEVYDPHPSMNALAPIERVVVPAKARGDK